MKVSIDTQQCFGHGRCYQTAPGLFAADDNGFGEVKGDGEVADGLAEPAQAAARQCPERAVQLTE